MVLVNKVFEPIGKFAVKNAPIILDSVGIIANVGAVVAACVQTPKAIQNVEKRKAKGGASKVDIFVEGAKAYWPVAVIEGFSIACVIFSNHENLKRQAALLAAYGLSETKFREYSEAVEKTFGDKKAREVKEKVAECEAKKVNTDTAKVIFTGSGNMPCIESITKQIANSSVEAIKEAFAVVEDMRNYNEFVSINDFLEAAGYSTSEELEMLGWRGEGYLGEHKQGVLKLDADSKLTANNVPALYIGYSIPPTWDLRQICD